MQTLTLLERQMQDRRWCHKNGYDFFYVHVLTTDFKSLEWLSTWNFLIYVRLYHVQMYAIMVYQGTKKRTENHHDISVSIANFNSEFKKVNVHGFLLSNPF